MARITGIGGIFFKSTNDNAALAAWYQKHLGMPIESFGGAVLKWPDERPRTRVSLYGTSRKEKATGSALATHRS
jgi:hypothetical protein